MRQAVGRTGSLWLLAVPLIGLAAGWLAGYVAPGAPSTDAVAQATAEGGPARAVRATENGAEVGDIMINEKLAIRLSGSGGGLSPSGRAQVVADRLNNGLAVNRNAQAEPAVSNGYHVVMFDGEVLLTPLKADLLPGGATMADMTRIWSNRVNNALASPAPRPVRDEGTRAPSDEGTAAPSDEGTSMAAEARAGTGQWPPPVDVTWETEGGRQVADVIVDGQPTIRLRARSREYTPYERAVVVAERLKKNAKPKKNLAFGSGVRNDSNVVLIRDEVLVTPLPDDLPEGMNTSEAARAWSRGLAYAYDVDYQEPRAAVGGPEPGGGAWEPAEPYDDKIVPIISVGSGQRIGGARVNGPRSQVRLVQAVAQLEARVLKQFQVEIYVPISTRVPGSTIDRVDGVAVTALGDLRL